MIVSVHQPHFLPWIPYLEKINQSDIFVLYDTVQFRKNYYQNRGLVQNEFCSKSTWLTLPVKKHPLNTKIKDIVLEKPFIKLNLFNKLEGLYKNKSALLKINEKITSDINNDNNLSNINLFFLKIALEIFNIKTPIILASQIDVSDSDNCPSTKLVNICKYLGATNYLSGINGKNYLKENIFFSSGIKVNYFNSSYMTNFSCTNDKSLSFIDFLCGEHTCSFDPKKLFLFK